jgi:hypothetical protein
MTRLMITLTASAVLGGDFAVLPASAAAQSSQAEVVVYGNDPCPRSTDDQIVVCSRRPENERYRLPKNQQLQGSRQERQSWANKSQSVMTAGATGINSCSPVGPGGHTGCMIQQIQREKQDAKEQAEQATAPEQ